MDKLLSIIIVNYNGKHFLADCLTSIYEYVSIPHEVIVVDNASTDGSCEFLKQHYPYVRLIENSKNTGFSDGNNLGVKEAKGDLLLLLNNDTCLLSSVMPAIEAFEKENKIGALGCKMLHKNGTLQPSIGFELTPFRIVLSWMGLGGFSFVPGIFKRVDDDVNHYIDIQEAAWVSGAFLMTRRGIWEKLGGLDERYFMYIEDVDYCKRVRMLGYRVVYTPQIEIMHFVGGGKSWVGEKALIDSMASYLIYLRKYYNKYTLFFVRSLLSSIMMARACFYYFASLISKSQIYVEKRIGYLRAAQYLNGIAPRD